MLILGLDVGSVSVKAALVDLNRRILNTWYVRHGGNPFRHASDLVNLALGEVAGDDVSLSITGSTGKTIASLLRLSPINEIVAQATATRHLLPRVRTVIEMGGEDCKLIILDDTGIKDFSMNSVCAAGTGSFLDQQAERLRLTIEEFGSTALRSKTPPRIAGRCSVFAKSDMIHLQQIATPVEDIVAGLCFAVARNFKGSIAKGRDLYPQVSFQGGVAANPGMRRAFAEVLNTSGLVIPEHFACMGAIGAALKALDDHSIIPLDLSSIRKIESGAHQMFLSHPSLVREGADFLSRHGASSAEQPELRECAEPMPVFMGIDIGSISTNLAVVEGNGTLLAKEYLMTAGRPIEAVMRGLREIEAKLGSHIVVRGVGTTGSGRYMIADFVGADIVKNEITAQATAAAFIDPEVDTIFEIGGQDSKYISLEKGAIVDFEMNKACAAGTGSFLEEQAEKLNVSIKSEFATCAFASAAPCQLGERCTVFMENSLMANLKKGVQKNDLLAGLAYSIVENYVNRVVAGKKIGDNIFFQGGVAFNKSVVAAFENFLGKRVTVPPHHDVTGAIGMALIARDFVGERGIGESKFKGFDIHKRKYSASSFECRGCSNVCEINRIQIEGEHERLFYGGRCEKYDVKRKRDNGLPDLFAFREDLLWKYHLERSASFSGDAGESGTSDRNNGDSRRHAKVRRPKIGIPYIFFFHEYLPFWSALLWELGFEVIVSPKTTREIVSLGVEAVQAEGCFPVKSAHGHIKFLLDAGVEHIFTPSFVDVQNPSVDSAGSPCPYTQAIPYLARSAFSREAIISPVIELSRGERNLEHELSRSLRPFGVSMRKIRRAMRTAKAAQSEFEEAKRLRAAEVLSAVRERTVVIIGRAYNAFDGGMNLQIPQKLSSLNVTAIPMDFLPLEGVDISDRWGQMYWRNGERILKAARLVRDNPLLFPLFIGNFSCGPDSFILKYFADELGDKPFLHIEIDEHSADAGAITRCEAFLDSIGNRTPASLRLPRQVASDRDTGTDITIRKIFIPKMSDHAFALQAALECAGVEAEVMPDTDDVAIRLGRKHVSGKECFPCAVTTGDMIKQASSPGFDASRSAFFMPSGTGPCRFGQYNVFQRLALERSGLAGVKIYSPVQSTQFYRDLGIVGKHFAERAWEGIVAIEILTKMLHETRPFERDEGVSDSLYGQYLERIRRTLRTSANSMDGLLTEMRDAFGAVPKAEREKPLIGIVGEIFVRSNAFSNEAIVRKVEELGGVVWLAPVEEWIYYVNFISLRKALRKMERSAIIQLFLKSFFQKRREHQFARHFEGYLRTLKEPSTRAILAKASPYVHDSFEGEAVLSIGKTIDLIERGAAGIINVMPFGCMPGTIVSGLLQRISREMGVPCISVAYDGTESTTTYLQLEAFLEQAKMRQRRFGRKDRPVVSQT